MQLYNNRGNAQLNVGEFSSAVRDFGEAVNIDRQFAPAYNNRGIAYSRYKKFDLAILHTDNTTPFSDVIAVIDAIYTPKRDFDFAGKSEKVPSFNVTFAVN